MKFTKITAFASIALAFLLAFGVNSNTFAQGRGNGGGRPSNPGGGGNGMGRPTSSPGVDRGLGTASERSGGRSDTGMGTASTNSNGRSDAGIERARMQRENRIQDANREISKNPRIGDNVRMNANDLRSGYEAALATNPNLKFGQYVAANMIARNLGSTNTNITSSAILSGLAQGNSIGETLRSLGVSRDEAKRAEKAAKRQMENRSGQ
jgi:hypothetical protein